MKKIPLPTVIAMALIMLISGALIEDEPPKYSELTEWGLSSDIRVVKAWYYKSIRSDGENTVPADMAGWDRMTVTCYDKKGMIDSLKVYTSKHSSSITFFYVQEAETTRTYSILNNDTLPYSNKYWLSPFNYMIEIFNGTKIETREQYLLDDKFRIKEIKREHYNPANNSTKLITNEHYYFDEKNQLDSIRTYTNGKFKELIINNDAKFDQRMNPTITIKKTGHTEPYLIVREFEYY